MDVSRSGRVRKKSSKLADFESPDDLELNQEETVSKKRSNRDSEYTSKSLSSLVVDDLPPDQLLADDTTSDFCFEDILNIKEEDFDDIPLLKVDEYREEDELDIGKDDGLRNVVSANPQIGNPNALDKDLDSDEEGNLMIDDTKGRPIKRSKVKIEKTKFAKNTRRRLSGKYTFAPFMLWAKTVRPRLEKQNNGIDFKKVKIRLAEMWRDLSDSEKYRWKRRAQTLTLKTSEVKQASQSKASVSVKHARSSFLVAAMSDRKSHDTSRDFVSSSMYRVTGTEPLDAAAHLKLLGESLSMIGERLCKHEGEIPIDNSMDVLLDSFICGIGPLMCVTQLVPELNGMPQELANQLLDNIAYIMPLHLIKM